VTVIAEPRADAQGAALRHGVDRVQHEVGDDLVQLGGPAHDHRDWTQLQLELQRHAALDLLLLPARPRDGQRVADDLVEIHGHERLVGSQPRERLDAATVAPPLTAFSITRFRGGPRRHCPGSGP
jgi:hypothetical protein